MLRQRVLTAIILLPIFILCVLKLSAPTFCYLTGLITLWGAWEWSSFMGLKSIPRRLSYLLVVVAALFITLLFLQIPSVLYVAFFVWIGALILIIFYPKTSGIWGKSVFLRGLMGLLVMVPCWLATNFVRTAENGPAILLFVFALVWIADSAAYFVGKKYGKHLLCPRVSPSKTWEGALGGIAAAMVISVLGLQLGGTPYKIWLPALVLAFVTIVFSIVGDLFESMMKRNAELKDSGTMLPGHGGILDRIDSLTAAMPVFALGAMLLGRYYL